MSVNKRKKSTRMRGKKTHGYGSKKKHRGHGNRGGSGMGGSGKRADSKKPSVQRIKDYFGKHGFKIKGQYPHITAINIIDWRKDSQHFFLPGMQPLRKAYIPLTSENLGTINFLAAESQQKNGASQQSVLQHRQAKKSRRQAAPSLFLMHL